MTIPVFQYLRQGFGENRVECTNSLASACAPIPCLCFMLQDAHVSIN